MEMLTRKDLATPRTGQKHGEFDMKRLPVEAIAHIMKFLPSLTDRKMCSLVCKSWYEAYQDPMFRNAEALVITSEERFETLLGLVNEDRKYFHVVLKEVEIEGANVLRFWGRFGPHVRTLSLFSCEIREKVFEYILKQCPRLQSLCVRSCRELFMVGHLFEDADEKLILKKTFESFKNLDLSFNRYLSDAVFVRFTEVFDSVRKLSVTGCRISFFSGLCKKFYPHGRGVPSESVFTFPVILDFVQKNSRRLQHLAFGETFIDDAAVCRLSQVEDLRLTSLELKGCFQLSAAGVVSLSEYQKTLTELDISQCPNVTDGALLVVCSGLPNLVSLSVQRCREITDLGVSGLCQLEELSRLNASECELIQGKGLLHGLCQKINPRFRELTLSHLGNLTVDVVVALSVNLPNLRLLDLGCCYKAVTDESLQSIFRNVCNLRTLILTRCKEVTDAGLTGMGAELGSKRVLSVSGVPETGESSSDGAGFSPRSMKYLQRLGLSGCRIGDVTLKHALESNELRDLDLSHCEKITEKGLEHLSKNNPTIEKLNLEFCHGVNNNGVRHVVQNLKRLRILVLGSDKINDSVAPVIARYGKNISHLNLTHCSQISDSAIDIISRTLPHLQYLHFSMTTAMSKSPIDHSVIPSPPVPFGLTFK